MFTNIDDKLEHTLQVCGGHQTEGSGQQIERGHCHHRYFNKLYKWTKHEVQQTNCQSLQLGRNNRMHEYRLQSKHDGKQLCRKYAVDRNRDIEQKPNMCLVTRKDMLLGCIKQNTASRSRDIIYK